VGRLVVGFGVMLLMLMTSVRYKGLEMTVSSRTPEGMPSNCPLCGASNNIEFSDSGQDATCPNCGHLLLASAQLVHAVGKHYADALGTRPGVFSADTQFSDLGFDSLDVVEMVMELEEEFDVRIPDDVAEGLETFGDVVRYIQDQRRETEG